MRVFTGAELLECYQAVKNGATKKMIMKMYGISAADAVRMYNEAYTIYCKKGYNPMLPVTTALDEAEEKTFPAERPPAKYDNMSREDYINKYLKMDI